MLAARSVSSVTSRPLSQWLIYLTGASGGYHGKYVGQFVSTASPGGGQESTFIASLSTYAHHGLSKFSLFALQ